MAFQEDDPVMALRAYQATLTHFRHWLDEEEKHRDQTRLAQREEEERQHRSHKVRVPHTGPDLISSGPDVFP